MQRGLVWFIKIYATKTRSIYLPRVIFLFLLVYDVVVVCSIKLLYLFSLLLKEEMKQWLGALNTASQSKHQAERLVQMADDDEVGPLKQSFSSSESLCIVTHDCVGFALLMRREFDEELTKKMVLFSYSMFRVNSLKNAFQFFFPLFKHRMVF